MRPVTIVTANAAWAATLKPELAALDCEAVHLTAPDVESSSSVAHPAPELVLLDYAQAHADTLERLQRLWPACEVIIFGDTPLARVFADLVRLQVLHYFTVPVTEPHQLALLILGSAAQAGLRRAQGQLQARAVHDAMHDPLTGLANGTMLHERLARALAQGRRLERSCAVLFLDVDRFKNVNDSLGPVAGDQLLIAVAERLKASVRPWDLVARLSGDEFSILLENVPDKHDARRAAERVQRSLQVPISLPGQELYVSASMGIAVNLSGQTSAKDLVQGANTAMYRAKARGGGAFEIFDSSMQNQAALFLGLENDLRRALSRRELVLYYQPIVSLQDGEVAGFEALLRWAHAERGMVGPADFIPVAEQTGLIVPIGKWALRQACHQAKAWEAYAFDGTPPFVSVNVSPRQMADLSLVDDVTSILQETGIRPSALKLEVTESLLIDTVPQAMEVMARLSALQVRLCIDDFGTGYSSLSTLSQFPVHTLKIDRAFVRRLTPEGKHGAIIDMIVTLAHTLGMDVIAEGIETAQQLEQLKSRRCEYGQGYYFSRPIPADQATGLLAGNAAAMSTASLVRAVAADGAKASPEGG